MNHLSRIDLHRVVMRLEAAKESENVDPKKIKPELKEAIDRTQHRIVHLEELCRIHYRGGAIQEYKRQRIALMASRRHLLKLIQVANGETPEIELSPWQSELKRFIG
jgi:hypothetical protein